MGLGVWYHPKATDKNAKLHCVEKLIRDIQETSCNLNRTRMWQRGDRFLQVCVRRAQESFVGVSLGKDVPSSKELVARKISEKVTNWCGGMVNTRLWLQLYV